MASNNVFNYLTKEVSTRVISIFTQKKSNQKLFFVYLGGSCPCFSDDLDALDRITNRAIAGRQETMHPLS